MVRDAVVIVTVAPVTIVLVENDYVGIPHVLQNLAFSPPLVWYLIYFLEECSFCTLNDFSRYAILLLASHSLIDFFQCWLAIKLVHGRQTLHGDKCLLTKYIHS